jgi:hypothetical protein
MCDREGMQGEKGKSGSTAQPLLHLLITQEIRHWKATKNVLFFKEVTAKWFTT